MGKSSIVTVNAEPTKIDTSISINVSPTSGNVPFDISVIGTLIDSAGNTLIGKSVVLYMNGAYVDTRLTQGGATAGQYGFSVVISDAGTYQCQVVFPGDDAYNGCNSAIVTVNAYTPRISTSISINVSPTSGNVPFTVTIDGTLTDSSGNPLDGKTVNLYSNGAVVSSTQTITGNYTFSMKITTADAYQFQTEFPGDDTYEGCNIPNGTHGMEGAPTNLLPFFIGIPIIGIVVYWLVKRK